MGTRNAPAMSLDVSQFQWKNRLLFHFARIDAMPMRLEEMRKKNRIGESGTTEPKESGGVK